MARNVILKSDVYSEILIKIADEKVYSREFVKQFVVGDETDYIQEENGKVITKPFKYSKQVPTLHRQLVKLQQEGFLGLDEGEEDGKKHEKNKKYFFIIWEAIIEEFIDSVISYKEADFKRSLRLFKERQDPEIVKEWEEATLDQINTLKHKEFRAKIKSNSILKSIFKNLFIHLQDDENVLPLIDIFDGIIEQNLLSKFEENLDKHYLRVSEKRRSAYFENEAEEKKVLNDHLINQLGEQGLKDYEFFQEFLIQLGYVPKLDHAEFFVEYLPSDVYQDIASEKKFNARLEEVFNPQYSRSEVAEVNSAISEILKVLKTLKFNEQKDRQILLSCAKKIARRFGAIELDNVRSSHEVLWNISPRAMIDLYMRKNLDEWITEVLVTLLCEYPFYFLGKYGRSGVTLKEEDKKFLRELWMESRLYRLYK